ncbi:MAG: hypothetical protein ACAI44_09820, partial [Candidatus Sericytochromatia bacterium]
YKLQLSGAGKDTNAYDGGGSGFSVSSTGSGCDSNEEWTMRIYNVDDTAKAYVNLNNIQTVSYQGDTGFLPINNYLDSGSNQVRFTLFNGIGGYSWGFTLKKNGVVVYQSEAGQAGGTGANNNDLSKPNQFVFDHTEAITSNICDTGGFRISSIAATPPANGPSAVNVWLQRDSQRVPVDATKLLGLGIDAPNLADLVIEIDGQALPIQQVAQNYVTFGIPANMSPGVKDVLIRLAGSNVTLDQAVEVLAMPPLEEVQSLPTVGAIGARSFLIGADRYLAIDSYYNGSTFNTTSQIYKWNGSDFQLHQFIPTVGAYDVEPFNIGTQLLAIANYDQNDYQAESKIMRWNGNQFVEIQSLPNHGGVDWEPFEINGEYYLAAANYFNGTFDQTSVIYKWNGTHFSNYQTIATHGAHKWTHFTIGTSEYLALTTYVSGQTDTDSQLYKWDGHQFVLDQTFATDNDMDFEHFTIGSEHFAAIINNGDAFHPTQSKVLKWDGSRFQDFQSFVTTGARTWGVFEADGWHYLVLITGTAYPQVYRWNGSAFELYRVISMAGAFASEFFSLGLHDHRLILTSYEANNYQAPSKVYRFE